MALSVSSPMTSQMSSQSDPVEASDISTEDCVEAKLKPIYFISGLGADERIFQWLRYEGYRPIHIPWTVPERGESVESYAGRLSEKIEDVKPIVVGLSFGGIVAVEIAKQMDVERVVLLSSVKDVSEVPFYFKLFRLLPLHRIVPFKSLLWAFYWLAYWLFAPEGTDQRALLKTVLQETDPHFLKWALHKVVVWKNTEVPDTIVHVHGRRDRIFPFRFVTPDYAVDNSGHLMVMNRADEISDLIEKLTLQSMTEP